jgi:hypothetical protein
MPSTSNSGYRLGGGRLTIAFPDGVTTVRVERGRLCTPAGQPDEHGSHIDRRAAGDETIGVLLDDGHGFAMRPNDADGGVVVALGPSRAITLTGTGDVAVSAPAGPSLPDKIEICSSCGQQLRTREA